MVRNVRFNHICSYIRITECLWQWQRFWSHVLAYLQREAIHIKEKYLRIFRPCCYYCNQENSSWSLQWHIIAFYSFYHMNKNPLENYQKVFTFFEEACKWLKSSGFLNFYTFIYRFLLKVILYFLYFYLGQFVWWRLVSCVENYTNHHLYHPYF